MRNFSDMEGAIYDWINGQSLVASEAIVYQIQNKPIPNSPYFSLRLTTFAKIGHDSLVGPDGSDEFELQGNREFTLMIRGFGISIVEKTNTLRDSLELDTVTQQLSDGGVVAYETNLPVIDISGLDQSENEERSSYDVLMRTDSIITAIDQGLIETINAEGTYSQPGKTDRVEQLNIDLT